MTDPTAQTISPTDLHVTIRAFLAAHGAGEPDVAARTFTADAVVVDQGETFTGIDRVRHFLRNAGSEFTYTTELIGAERIDETRWVAVNRIEGDFPGGVADLAYRFVLRGDLISELTIG
ncbi:hypothetical protein GCM10027425_10700 [Alteromonas gracilis]